MTTKKPVKLQVLVDADLAEKIRKLAERMGTSDSKMCGWLLEEAVSQNQFVINAVTSRIGKAVHGILTGKKKGWHATDGA
jgi:hypothetical protein